jgi:hypothetical protein
MVYTVFAREVITVINNFMGIINNRYEEKK